MSNPPSSERIDEDGESIDDDEGSADEDRELTHEYGDCIVDGVDLVKRESTSPSPVFKRLPPFRPFPALRRSPTLKPFPCLEPWNLSERGLDTEAEQTSQTMFDHGFAATSPPGPIDYDTDDQHSAADHHVAYDAEDGTPAAVVLAARAPTPTAELDGESEEADRDHTSASLIEPLHQWGADRPVPIQMGRGRTKSSYSLSVSE